MLGYSTLKEVFAAIINTNVVKEVYHSVIIREDETGVKKPSAPVGTKYVYVGIDDTKGFTCYCRALGPIDFNKEEKVGGCNNKILTGVIPHRLVFFSAAESRNHDDITARLINAITGTPATLKKVNTVVDSIIQQENPNGKFSLKTSAYFLAIDFNVFLKIQTTTCEQEIKCEGINNPYRI